MSDFLNEFDNAIAEIEAVKQRLIDFMSDKLDKVTDASYIKRISDNCFIIPSSKLGKDWTAQYHDTKTQAEELKKYIETHTIEKTISELRYIKEHKQWSAGYQKQLTGIANFNDEFIEQIFTVK